MSNSRRKSIFGSLFKEPAVDYKSLKDENASRVERDENYKRSQPKGLPIYVNIETTRQCNLTCRFCPFHSSSEAKKRWGVAAGTMELSRFKAIAEDIFPTLKTCALSVTGEFTLTDYLADVFKLLDKYSVKFDGFTNAMLLSPEISAMMMPHLECFTVSFDSPEQGTYEYLRRGARWGQVIENIRTLMAAREKLHNEHRPRIDLQAVLMKATVESLPELVRMAKRMGFDLVKGVHLAVFTKDMLDESLLKHRELYNKVREDAVEVAKEVGIDILLPPPLSDNTQALEQRGKPPEGCEFLWRRSFINYDCSVFSCCAPRPPLVGNLTGASFEGVWRGAAYALLRNRIFTEDPHPSCARCWIKSSNIPAGMEEEYLFQLD